MNEDRNQMAQVLEGEHRLPVLRSLIRLVNSDVSSVLDIGCGVGILTPLLKQKAPLASIIGIDRSQYMLREFRKKRLESRIELVLGEAPTFPFAMRCFDLVIAVQSLHEICNFLGNDALKTTIERIHDLLKENASFIVLDHENPGIDFIRIRLPPHIFSVLEIFRMKFQPREIVFDKVSCYDVEMPLRDFYDFVTKIWALNTPLEQEEMNETHTAFTGPEFVRLIERVGMSVSYLDNVTPIDNHLKRYGISIITKRNLPGRHLILRAEKLG